MTTIEGTILQAGESQRGRVYTEEALRSAADSLEEKPVTVDFDATPGNRIGNVTHAEYDESESAVVFEATIDDDHSHLVEEGTVAPRLFYLDDEVIGFSGAGVVPEGTDLVGDTDIVD